MPHLGLNYVQASYMEDTHLILQAYLANLQVAKEVLQQFSVASGLTIQWATSEA